MARSEVVHMEINRLRREIIKIKKLHKDGTLPFSKACEALKKATSSLQKVTHDSRVLKAGGY